MTYLDDLAAGALELPGPPRLGMSTPVTRSLPARLDVYIAPSALIMSSSAVVPSLG